MRVKKTIYVMVMFCMMAGLSSCEIEKKNLSEKENITPVEYEKSTKDISNIVKNGFFTMSIWKDDIVVSEKDNNEDYTYHYINKNSWEEEKRIEISADEERGHVVKSSIDAQGNLYMLRVDGHTAGESNAAIYVLKYLADGNTHVEQNVMNLITQVKWEGDGISGLVGIVAVDGDRLAVVTDYQVILLDKEFKKADYILSDDKIVATAKMKDGNMVCVLENETETMFCKLDVSKKKWKDSVSVIKEWLDEDDDTVLDGSEYDFYYKNAKGIFGINWSERQYAQLIDYNNVDVNKEGEEDKHMLPLADGTMVTQNMEACIISGKAELQMYMTK